MKRSTFAALLIGSIMVGTAAVAAALSNGGDVESSAVSAQPVAHVEVMEAREEPASNAAMIPPQRLYRVGDSDGMTTGGRGFPTFAQTPLPPVPQGSGWTWTYHKSRWTDDGCLEDKVSFGGSVYWLTACCCGYTMSRECPEEFCDD